MIAIISDIHGNYTALCEVLKEIDKFGIKEIYNLGDVIGYYSQVNECCEELRKRKVISVMGNHDFYLATNTNCPRSRSVNECLAYQRKIISQENLNWIKSLPKKIIVGDIGFVHGGWIDNIDEYLNPSEEYFLKIEGKYFVSGHTHIQMSVKYGEKIYCNPGSVGQPRDEDNRAAFATFDGKDFALHRVNYDIENVGRLMEEAGFNDYYYGGLFTGARYLTRRRSI
jgi:putative phosphoesterase